MKKIIEHIKFYFPTLLALFLVFFFWDKINFNFKNPKEIYGYHSINEYSSLNDNIRYIITILIPSIIFFFSLTKKYQLNFADIRKLFIIRLEDSKTVRASFSLLIIYIATILFYFLSLDFNISKMDLFHEGQVLMGAKNFQFKESLWSGNYIVTSLFIDILNAKISWSLSGIQNVSSYRLFMNFLNMAGLVSAVIFIYNLTNISELQKQKSKTILFLLLSIVIFYFFKNGSLSFREIPLFLFFSLVILSNKKRSSLLNVLIGFLPLISILWSLDRGIFLIFIYFFFIFFLFLNRRIKDLTIIFFSIILSFFILYQIVGHLEFVSFISNSIDVLNSSELLNGIIHPVPFTDEINSSRATKSILIILLNTLLLIYFFLNQREKSLNSFKLILFLFLIESIIFYKIGLTRSDGGHIKQGSALATFQLILFLSYILFFKIEKNQTFETIIKIFPICTFFLFTIFIWDNFKFNQIKNIFSFKERLENFISIDDYNYLNRSEKILIKKLNILLKKENCFQIFTYETAIHYFVNKMTCTKFSHIMNLGNKKNQLHFVDQLIETNPKYILTGGTYSKIGNMKYDNTNRLSAENRFPYINNYIYKHYEVYQKIESWNILINKNFKN